MLKKILAVSAACLLLAGCGSQAQPQKDYSQEELPYGATITSLSDTTIAVEYDARFVTEGMRDTVIRYYNAIQNKDVDSYIAVQLPPWHDYVVNTVYAGQFTDLQLMKTAYDTCAKDFGGSFTYTQIVIDSAKQCAAESEWSQIADVLDKLAEEQKTEKISKDISAAWEITVTRYLDKKGSEVRGSTKTALKGERLYLVEYQAQWYIIIT